MLRKERITYYFSVEGETEKWYLDWLQKTINSQESTKYFVKLESTVQKNPLETVKRMNIIGPTEIAHFLDYESNDDEHVQNFIHVLDQMKLAQSSGKSINYRLGYSNYTFELWIILHKQDCRRQLSHRSQYLEYINHAFNEHFGSLSEYKQKDNFKRILDKINIEDVKKAIERSKAITLHNKDAGYVLQQYKKYKYYKENPSLSIWEIIEEILKKCVLM